MTNHGGVTTILFHAVPNADGTIRHWKHDVPDDLYDALPHLYIVCLADRNDGNRKVTSAFFAKTSFHHEEDGFTDAMFGALASIPTLFSLVGQSTTLLPAKVGIRGSPPTESEMLRIVMTQLLKFSTAGNA